MILFSMHCCGDDGSGDDGNDDGDDATITAPHSIVLYIGKFFNSMVLFRF